jgi:hypothetical protein
VIHPALGDLVTALRAIEGSRPAELLVWVVSCDDVRRATPLRVFAKAAELLLYRAREWGAARVVILFVPEPAVVPERRALYAEELRRAASAHRATFERVDAMEEARHWRAHGALLRYPNEEGHEALARAILSAIGGP